MVPLQTSEEYAELHACYKSAFNSSSPDPAPAGRGRAFLPPPCYFKLPETVDWRTKDAVSSIKNQV